MTTETEDNSLRTEWTGEWHRADGSSFEAKIVGHHEGAIDFTEANYNIEVAHDSGRLYYLTVEAVQDLAAVECRLADKDETFMHPEMMASVTKAMSLATPALVKWEGYTGGDE